MTAKLRRGGSLVAYAFTGKIPDPCELREFPAALTKQRFRTIESAASEETSVGWCSPDDPSGDSFENLEVDPAERATWLRFRIDVKKLPKSVFAVHLAAAERAKGRRLSGRERRELKQDLIEKLLPRVLPATTFVDALLRRHTGDVLLFAGGKSIRTAFESLFFRTFALPLERQGPLEVAQRRLQGDATKALEKAAPTRWPVVKGGAA